MTITVIVRNNQVEKAMRVLKKKIQKDGLMKELRQRQYYENPSLIRQRKLKESLRRIAKEKRQMDIKEKIIEKSGYDHVFTVDGDGGAEYNQIKSRVEMNSKR